MNASCDDNNTLAGDGCDSSCRVETGFTCNVIYVPTQCKEVCGDGRVYVDECDDNNTVSGDGCSSECKI